jgi:hypothetical protein
MWLYAGNILTIHRPALFRTQDAARAAWPHTIRAAATHRYSEHRMTNPVVCPVPPSTTGLPPRRAATHRSSEHRMINPVVCPVPRSTTGLSPRRAATHRRSEHRMVNPVVRPVPQSTTGLPPRCAITHRRSEHRMANPVVRPVLQSTTGLSPGVLQCRHQPSPCAPRMILRTSQITTVSTMILPRCPKYGVLESSHAHH